MPNPSLITMGDDEFILYIRKNYPNCQIRNDQLGREISIYLREHWGVTDDDISFNEPCYWGNEGNHIGELRLPKTSAQFTFLRAALPELYSFLDGLGLN